MDGYYLKKCMEFKLIMNKIDNIKEYNLSGPAAIDGYSPAQLDRFEWKNSLKELLMNLSKLQKLTSIMKIHYIISLLFTNTTLY